MPIKTLPIVLLTLVLGLAACQESDDDGAAETDAETTEEAQESDS